MALSIVLMNFNSSVAFAIEFGSIDQDFSFDKTELTYYTPSSGSGHGRFTGLFFAENEFSFLGKNINLNSQYQSATSHLYLFVSNGDAGSITFDATNSISLKFSSSDANNPSNRAIFHVHNNSDTKLSAGSDVELTATYSGGGSILFGTLVEEGGQLDVIANNGGISLSVDAQSGSANFGSVSMIHTRGDLQTSTSTILRAEKNIILSASQTGGYGAVDGIYTTGNKTGESKAEITSVNGNIVLSVSGEDSNYKNDSSAYTVSAIRNNVTYLEGQTISTSLKTEGVGDIILSSIGDDTYFAYGILNNYGKVSLIGNENNVVQSNQDISLIKISAESKHKQATAIYQGIYGEETAIHGDAIEITAQTTGTNGTSYALRSQGELTDIDSKSYVSFTATSLTGNAYGIYAYNSTTDIQIDAVNNISIIANSNTSNHSDPEEPSDKFGSGIAIYGTKASSVVLNAGFQNIILGSVSAIGSNSTDSTLISLSAKQNVVASSATIDGAGDLNVDEKFDGKSIISALYAEGSDADIKLTGRNQILSYADHENPNQLERTVWAYDGADISLDGWTLISTDSYDKSPNSADVAIAAGTAVGLDETDFGENYPTNDAQLSKVEIQYENDAGEYSSISGDILSAYAGVVSVTAKNSDSGLNVNGNLLAGNGGTLTVDLGKGGTITGRTDDYVDAGTTTNGNDHATFFNPAFSSTIYQGGKVTLKMGEGSTWNVTGQSWLTNLTGNGGTIVLTNSVSESSGEDLSSHALHIQHLEGQHVFEVKLNDADHLLSDMLYVNNVAQGAEQQIIRIASLEGLEEMQHNDRIRFATVNASEASLSFVSEEDLEVGTATLGNRMSRTLVRDQGFFDVGFRIENETRVDDKTENDYDGEEFSETKPGEEYVEDYYGSNEESQNWYLVRDKSGDSTSDGGETILATARAAYWNAVEIDRLNKRLGDARHADGGTDGFWVRVRNDRIGTDAGVGDFRSRNYAYQFGYDHTKKEDDGKRLFGAALDYMDGNTTYRDVEGTGATDRFGVTAYMTWLGDDGWYYDLIGKWGVLSNSFRITSDTGVYVDGDYDNHVLGASFEFGRKLTKENSLWFLEPQAQIQHVMVTEASYSTNQGTHVDHDKINSTITRLGFRIGRNFGEKQSGLFYAKADWLKEWHGHQGIRVTDVTTGNRAADVSIDNKGNWFDVGLGVQSPITDKTYFFVDAEYVFGNDLDNTWNFNAGLRWMFH